MQLVEQRKIDLDTDVNEYIDFVIPPLEGSTPITVRHLLTHTPGFEDYANKIFTLEKEQLLPLEAYVREFLPVRIFPAGEVLAYSNYGTALAGYIVERISGQSFTAYIEEHIFTKLQMNHSMFEQPIREPLANHAVTPYRYVDGSFKEAKFEFMPAPAGGMSSSASDMAKFMLALLQGGRFGDESILKEETVKEMFTQQFTHHPELNGMTLGWMEGDTNGKRIVMHGGSTMLFNSMLYLVPDENLGIFLSYSGGNHLLHNELFHELMDELYPEEKENVTQATNRAKEELKQIAGEYQQNRKSLTTEDKFASLHSGLIQVDVAEAGYLHVTHMGETYPFYEVEQGVFKTTATENWKDPYGNFDTLVFTEDKQGNLMLIPDGPMTYTKAFWYETSRFTFLSLGVVILFVIGTLLAWLISSLIRLIRKKKSNADKVQKIATFIGVIYGLLIVELLISLIVNGGVDSVYQLPKDAYMGNETTLFDQLFPYVFGLLTFGLVIFTIVSWLKRSRRLFSRVHYTFYTGTALFFCWFFSFWNVF